MRNLLRTLETGCQQFFDWWFYPKTTYEVRLFSRGRVFALVPHYKDGQLCDQFGLTERDWDDFARRALKDVGAIPIEADTKSIPSSDAPNIS
jgi:hypothetical protein